MKQKAGVLLLIILNLAFIYIIIMGAKLAYVLMVAPVGYESGLKIANQTAADIILNLCIASLVMIVVNYCLFKKMIPVNKPVLYSIIITLFGMAVFTPFFISARQSFLNYQSNTTQLRHYLDKQTISAAQIITQAGSFQIRQLDDFIRDIGYAKYKRGAWKYSKNIKIVFKRTDGNSDSLFTNGQMFNYKSKEFSADRNILDKYLGL